MPAKSSYNRPQQAAYFLADPPVHVPLTMMKDFLIQAQSLDGSWLTLADVKGNYQRLVRCQLELAEAVTAVRFVPLASWGSPDFHVFSFDVQ